MKIGIGIDTGGTCTDGVIYQFEDKKILAYAKTPTTKEDLSIGIGKVIDALPLELLREAEIVSLSTTLATNACVENKGGRAKLIFFGLPQDHMKEVKNNQGLIDHNQLIFVESVTNCMGEIVQQPDWEAFQNNICDELSGCDAVAIVELFANKTGAVLEKRAREIVKQKLDIPVVCGHELFSELNIIKRGASALLNARLIPVIKEFIGAVGKAMAEREMHIPIAIVRSDGSLMNEKAALEYPIDTILCGPVSSLLGALELSQLTTGMVVDMGGTTTDIAYIKNSVPKKVTSGVQIGSWSTFVKGLFVDTFGLGGDSEVTITKSNKLALQVTKAYPLCMAASQYPALLAYLKEEDQKKVSELKGFPDIYLGLKDISQVDKYTSFEKKVATTLKNEPMALPVLQKQIGEKVIKLSLERLVEEGVIIKCGVTPTDAMHYKGDFTQYSVEAATYGLSIMAKCIGSKTDALGDQIYELVIHKLYVNVLRSLIEDEYAHKLDKESDQFIYEMIEKAYKKAQEGKSEEDKQVINFHSPYTLIGAGAPTYIFLDKVGQYLKCNVVNSQYAKVANALGAIVSNVSATATIEVTFQDATGLYIISGDGIRETSYDYQEAQTIAKQSAHQRAQQKATNYGATTNTQVTLKTQENTIPTAYGQVFLNYTVQATAKGYF